MNTYESGPAKPIIQQAPKAKSVDNDESEDDRFSIASSSDLSESTKTISVTNVTKGKTNSKMKGKSIKI
mgnify:CR=1 FL=1